MGYFVTGATGFIGRNLVELLLAREGTIYVSGSGQLVRALLGEGLVDELHLFVYPVALGEGERFWADGEHHQLALRAHDVYDNGVVHLCYGPAPRN